MIWGENVFLVKKNFQEKKLKIIFIFEKNWPNFKKETKKFHLFSFFFFARKLIWEGNVFKVKKKFTKKRFSKTCFFFSLKRNEKNFPNFQKNTKKFTKKKIVHDFFSPHERNKTNFPNFFEKTQKISLINVFFSKKDDFKRNFTKKNSLI